MTFTDGPGSLYNLEFGQPSSDTAVCISGFMRLCRKTFPTYETHLLKDTNADIYVATWDISGNRYWKSSTGDEPERRITPDFMRNVYGHRLKGVAVTPFSTDAFLPFWFKELDPFAAQYVRRVVSMYYHIWVTKRIRQTAENHFGHRYKKVVRLRSDIGLYEDLATFVNSDLKQGVVYTTEHESYGVVNDQFMFGLVETMDVISETYSHILARTPEVVGRDACPICPAERLLLACIKHHGFQIENVPFQYVRYLHQEPEGTL